MTAQDLYGKIEWEGGMLAVLEYGVGPEDVPEQLKELWTVASHQYAELEALSTAIYTLVEELARQEEDHFQGLEQDGPGA